MSRIAKFVGLTGAPAERCGGQASRGKLRVERSSNGGAKASSPLGGSGSSGSMQAGCWSRSCRNISPPSHQLRRLRLNSASSSPTPCFQRLLELAQSRQAVSWDTHSPCKWSTPQRGRAFRRRRQICRSSQNGRRLVLAPATNWPWMVVFLRVWLDAGTPRSAQ